MLWMSGCAVDPLWLALGLGGVFWVGSELILNRWLNIQERAWNSIEYFMLILATVGIISAASDIRRASAEGQLDDAESFAAAEYLRAVDRISLTQSFLYCSPPFEPVNPGDRDDLVEQYVEVCEWGREAQGAVSADPPEDFRQFDLAGLPPADGLVVGTGSGEPIWEVERSFRSYNRAAVEVAELREAARRSGLDSVLLVLGPFLLAAASGLALAKNSFNRKQL